MKKTNLLLLVFVLVLAACAPAMPQFGGNGSQSTPDTSQVSSPPESPPSDFSSHGSAQPQPVAPEPPPVEPEQSSAEPEASSALGSAGELSSAAPAVQSSSVTESPLPNPPAESSSSQAAQELPDSSEPAQNPPDAQSMPESAVSAIATPRTFSSYDEVKAVWFSYLEFLTLAQNKTKSEFTSNISHAFDRVAEAGFNSVWVQVRPFGDAMYPSGIFPYSYVLTGTEGVSPGYDPLAIMVGEAHARGLLIEAWINPYRIRANASDKALSDSNPAVRFLAQGSDAVIRYGNIISYNPSSKAARDLIVQGVVEIINNYDIDGIHFDDYFYPTTDLAFDSSYYNAYRAAGGQLQHEDWRRQNVNLLIAQVYSAVKQADSSVVFGVSPQANMSNNYNSQFVDVVHWLANPGYVDYICPQVYFGFENQTLPFASTVRDWSALITNGHTKLYIGIAAYKIGSEDKYAGSGSREWITGKNILARMVSESRACGAYAGFGMYRYDFLFSPASGLRVQMEGEMSALRQLIKD